MFKLNPNSVLDLLYGNIGRVKGFCNLFGTVGVAMSNYHNRVKLVLEFDYL